MLTREEVCREWNTKSAALPASLANRWFFAKIYLITSQNTPGIVEVLTDLLTACANYLLILVSLDVAAERTPDEITLVH